MSLLDGYNGYENNAQNLPSNPDLQVSMEDVLDKLGVLRMCCRIHLSAFLDYRDEYL